MALTRLSHSNAWPGTASTKINIKALADTYVYMYEYLQTCVSRFLHVYKHVYR
jgi:hypothetical protein